MTLVRDYQVHAEWFTTTRQAQIVISQWLRQYSHTRPHQALNMRPPVPETLVRNGPELGAAMPHWNTSGADHGTTPFPRSS